MKGKAASTIALTVETLDLGPTADSKAACPVSIGGEREGRLLRDTLTVSWDDEQTESGKERSQPELKPANRSERCICFAAHLGAMKLAV